MQFTDSISENIEILRELLVGLPPQSRKRAQRAAVEFENTFNRLQKDNPKDAAIALGAAFAVFLLAERMVDAPKQGDSQQGLIQLLQ